MFSEYHAVGATAGMYMVRKGRWKYVHYVGHRPQLFDLEADPHEGTDLGESSAHAAVRAELEAALRQIVDPDAANAQAGVGATLVAMARLKNRGMYDQTYGWCPVPCRSPSHCRPPPRPASAST